MIQRTQDEAADAAGKEEPAVPVVEPPGPDTVVVSGEEGAPVCEIEDTDSPPRPPEVEDFEQVLAEARHEAAERWNELLRARAELENLRKRSQREVENAHKFGLERFVSELLPVRDGLELGLAAAGEGDTDIAGVCQGLYLTLKMLNAALEKFGVEEINPVDDRFDPEFHQAMSVQEVPGKGPGEIAMVVQKGFLLNRRLLRPAMVIVAK